MNNEKIVLAPQLRFPEFINSGSWKKIKLIETADKRVRWSFIGGPFGSNLQSSDYTSNGVRVIQLQNIGDGQFNNEYKIFTSVEKADELLSCNIYPNEIILSKMGDPVGRACLIPDLHSRYVMCSDGIRLVVDEKKYNKYFIYSLINSKQFRALVQNNAIGSTRKRIGLDVLKNLQMTVPKLPEQQKIADCLSSLDDLITAESNKLEMLKVYRRGLIRKLFPSENKTKPDLRFHEFRNNDAWAQIRFIDTANKKVDWSYTGGPFGSDLQSSDYTISGVRVIQLQNIGDGVFKDEFRVFTSEEKADDLLSCNIYPNDIILSKMGDPVGRACIVPNLHSRYVMCSDGIRLVVDEAKYDRYFIFSLINSEQFRRNVLNSSTGTTRKRIGLDVLKNLQIMVPPLPEQQKIGNCILSLDMLVAQAVKRIEALKSHKIGLVQKLVPSIKESGE